MYKQSGFTLVEVLVAMFIFTILSMMMLGGLQSVITAQNVTNRHAEELRDMQMGLLMLSRDIEQIIDRPVLSVTGRQEPALVGTSNSVTFTHGGVANPKGQWLQSALMRTQYVFRQQALWRQNWAVLDQAPESKSHARKILPAVNAVKFEYLDQSGHFQLQWPRQHQGKSGLPRAVRVTFTFSGWGELTQLYVIPVATETKTTESR